MSTSEAVRVALIGNPNTGKSTLFTALSGVHQQTGNYPGVTVEKKVGFAEFAGRKIEWIDLPGTYSLFARSQDEQVAVDVLLGLTPGESKPDVVVCVVDASNLDRNLFLVSQLLDLEIPIVVALNMVDVAKSKGTTVHREVLEKVLGVPVVTTQANKRTGIAELKRAVVGEHRVSSATAWGKFPTLFQEEVNALGRAIHDPRLPHPRFIVEQLVLAVEIPGHPLIKRLSPADLQEVQKTRTKLLDAGLDLATVDPIARYSWIGELSAQVQTRTEKLGGVSWSERIDQILVHKVSGTLWFFFVMLLIFQAIFSWANPFMDGIEGALNQLSDAVGSTLSDGPLKSLLTQGVIGGVGGVLVFLPQILILFFFIGILEDCGYMSRAAMLMDRLMSKVGLNGKSFIPLLSSFACAVPGIMATRVIESKRDRLITILIAPLMSCSARIPVYVVMAGAFVPEIEWLGGIVSLQGITMFSMYLLGMVVAVIVAFILKSTVLKGESQPFIMELPSFKFPSLRVVFMRMMDRGWEFVYRAGTLILAVSILVWAIGYFPRSEAVLVKYEPELARLQTEMDALPAGPAKDSLKETAEKLEHQMNGELLERSFLGQGGKIIEPIVRPLGWDWRIGCAVIASFPAREVVIGTMGVIYQLGEDQDEESKSLPEALQNATWAGTDKKVFNLPVALSIMVFFALCAQCSSTLVAIRRETGDWRWALFTFVYMTSAAYVGALITYQVGMLLM